MDFKKSKVKRACSKRIGMHKNGLIETLDGLMFPSENNGVYKKRDRSHTRVT